MNKEIITQTLYDGAVKIIKNPQEMAEPVRRITFRTCRICKEDKIDTSLPEWRTMCGKCYVLNHRECSICEKLRIGIHEPAWKNRCGSCYKKKN